MGTMFTPALYRQRHQFVIDFVKKNQPRKVVDLGCGECSLLKYLKFHREVELLVGVDINGAKLKKHMHDLRPVSTDYLQPTFDQLRIELYQGSVTQNDTRLRGFDLVTSIELIEHLTLPDVQRFSEVVFGHMVPVSVIVSTPNSEFNPLFPGLKGFRHHDHKFEWTRAEFQSWALKVSAEYGYEVEFTGVGEAPTGQQERVGFCSQIAVFQRLKGRDDGNILFGDDAEDEFSYTLLYSITYPSLHDNNILRRVLVAEVLGWTEKLKSRYTEKGNEERDNNDTTCQTEGGRDERLSSSACGAETNYLMDHRDRRTAENQRGLKCCRLQRGVSVPLGVLWTSCPKVGALSKSLSNLRHVLMDEPEVTLSPDGFSLLVNLQEQEQDLEDEEDHEGLEDSGYTEASQCSHSAAQEEDWETNMGGGEEGLCFGDK
ncbi:small RNA 2'-O-methyltransferase isoform X2 [Xyrichtys novacula]|uniref:Small RNA 2'-O-methyltransferase n=1 Tax=Xyrichtys novacula TaxID=13765 RepID=A0AAV1FKE1_XYRNO|nr:small RNA 2'-O-methyltransferase isoform X2 [Xyrichtys novacula]